MANLNETPTWDAGVYQLEVTDPVEGGVNGVSNLQAKQLANRTRYLKEQLEALPAPGTDHGALGGLGDDDHPQYLTQSRGDARYSQTGHGHAISDVSGLGTALDQVTSHIGSGGGAHANATTSVAGFMAAADKAKLEGIADSANNYTHPASHPPGIITQDASNRFVTDAEKATWNAKQAALGFTPENSANKGQADGYAGLDATGKVPSAQLPSFVDDVLEFANLASFPGTGEAGKIFVALDTNKTYRWGGSSYTFITSGAVDSVAGKTGVVTLVKADVGLGSVDNTADSAKPVSTAQQTALNGKENSIATGTASQFWRGDKSWTDFATTVRAATLTGLSTAISTVVAAADTVLVAVGKLQAQITANLTTLTTHTGSTSNPHSVTKAQVGLGSVENTALSTWAGSANVTTVGTVSTGAWEATDVAVVHGGTGASDAATARANLGLAIGTNVQAYDADLTTLGGLAKTDGNFIVGDGTNWVAESGATARASLGLGTAATANTGTSGTAVPLLDAANTWSADQTFGTVKAAKQRHVGAFVSEFFQSYTPSSNLTAGEYQEVCTVTPTLGSQNTVVYGEAVVTAGATSQLIRFNVYIRSNTLPSLTLVGTWNESLVGTTSSYVKPVVFFDATNGVMKLALKHITGTVQGISVHVVGVHRGNYEYVVMNTTATSDTTTVPAGFVESDITKTYSEIGADFTPAVGTRTGEVARSIQQRDRDVVNVRDFIPATVNTATTDCTTYVQAALTYAAANTPCKVEFGSGTFKLDSTLGSYTASDLTVDLTGATLDFSGAVTTPHTYMLEFAGSYSATPVVLSANAVVSTQAISCVSTTFTVGDLVRVYSSKLWDPVYGSGNTKIGELNFVETKPNGTSLTLVTPLACDYATADTAYIHKLTPVRNVHVVGGKIVGPGADDQLGGIHIKLGVGCSVRDVRTADFDVYHVRLTDCVQSTVSGCYINEANHTAQAYGISCADACQDCLVTNNTLTNIRHAFTTNNNVSTSYGVVRRITVSNNNVYNNVNNVAGTSGDALDAHPGSEDIYFLHNSVHGAYGVGINVEARTGVVHGNSINGCTSSGIRCAPYCDLYDSEYHITDNSIRMAGDASGADYGINVSPQARGVRRLVISNNRAEAKDSTIAVTGDASKTVTDVVVANNVLKPLSGLTDSGDASIYLVYVTNYAVTGNVCTTLNLGILLSSCTNGTVSGNTVELSGTSGATAYGIQLSGGSRSSITGNVVKFSGSGVATTLGIYMISTVSYSGAWSNVISAFGTAISIHATAATNGCVQANNLTAP